MEALLRRPVTLSRVTFALLWQAEQPDTEPHPALPVDLAQALGGTATLRTATNNAADELGRLGLFDPSNGLHPDLSDALAVLARPAVECYGWLGRQNLPHTLSALAAIAGNRGVLAVLDDSAVRLAPITPSQAASALVGVLPPVPPAAAAPISLPAADLAPPAPDPGEPLFTGLHGPPPDPALSTLLDLLRQPRTATAQLHTAHRDQHGHRRRSPTPLTVIDTPAGRWSIRRAPDSTGQIWLTVAPASPTQLVAHLDDALHRSRQRHVTQHR